MGTSGMRCKTVVRTRIRWCSPEATTGTENGEPKIACPLHKRAFSLRSGKFLGEGEMACLTTYEVKLVGEKVFVQV